MWSLLQIYALAALKVVLNALKHAHSIKKAMNMFLKNTKNACVKDENVWYNADRVVRLEPELS